MSGVSLLYVRSYYSGLVTAHMDLYGDLPAPSTAPSQSSGGALNVRSLEYLQFLVYFGDDGVEG